MTDRDIRQAAESGVRTLRQLRQQTGCAGTCGQCASMARGLLEECQAPAEPLFPQILQPNPNPA